MIVSFTILMSAKSSLRRRHSQFGGGNELKPFDLMQAASPDEAALVVAAKVLGAFFFRRTPSTVFTMEIGNVGEQVTHEYELLAVLEFNSSRKRQSVIVRQSDGTIRLFCKVQKNIFLHSETREALAKICKKAMAQS